MENSAPQSDMEHPVVQSGPKAEVSQEEIARQKSLLGCGTFSDVTLENGMAVKTVSNHHFEYVVREIALLSACDHPNIIHIDKVGFTHDTCRLYMKRYSMDLYDLLKKPLPLRYVTMYSRDLLSALKYIHRRGFIHGDVKPKNLLVDAENDSLILCDFGIGVLTMEKYHNTSIQSAPYRAPEVDYSRLRMQFSAKIDVWSAGCVIYDMLCGRPFVSDRESCNDTTINIAKKYGISNLSDRTDRLRVLRTMTFEYVHSYIKTLVTDLPDRYKVDIDPRLAVLLASCLLPNHILRVTAGEALVMAEELCDAPAPVVITYPVVIAGGATDVDDLLCVRCVSFRIISECSSDTLRYAESLFVRYINDVEVTDVVELLRIRLACLFMAINLFSGNINGQMMIEDHDDYPAILDSARKILLQLQCTFW